MRRAALPVMLSTLIGVGCGGGDGAPAGGESELVVQRTPADAYSAEVEAFQEERDAVLRADNGWLTIAGLWFLTQPLTTAVSP